MPAGGYAWWYLDAFSDDGRHGITLIGFIGSVFSPYYAWARRGAKGLAEPQRHVALNVALYGPGRRWAMTERDAAALDRGPGHLAIGPSLLAGEADRLRIRFDERAAPIPRRVQGEVDVHIPAAEPIAYALDPEGLHRWRPIAPCARVEVRLRRPALAWAGPAYFDSNWGGVPLEDSFLGWTWSRAATARGATVHYETWPRDAGATRLALDFDRHGGVTKEDLPPLRHLPRTGWRLARTARSEAEPKLLQSLEDTPFYARALIEQRLEGASVQAVHENLSLARFTHPLVQAMLPFRMPRITGGRANRTAGGAVAP